MMPSSVKAQESWGVTVVVPGGGVQPASLPSIILGEFSGYVYQDGYYGPQYCGSFSESVTEGSTVVQLPFESGYSKAVLSASTSITSSYTITLTDATTRVVTLDGEGYAKLQYKGIERIADYNLLSQTTVPVPAIPITGTYAVTTQYTSTVDTLAAQEVTFSSFTMVNFNGPMNNRIVMDTKWSGKACVWYSKPNTVYMPLICTKIPDICEPLSRGQIHITSKGNTDTYSLAEYADGKILTLKNGENSDWLAETRIWVTFPDQELMVLDYNWKQYEPIQLPDYGGRGVNEFILPAQPLYPGFRFSLNLKIRFWPTGIESEVALCESGAMIEFRIDP